VGAALQFLTIHNQHLWCTECVAIGQRMGWKAVRYCAGKEGCHHFLISVENTIVKVVVLK